MAVVLFPHVKSEWNKLSHIIADLFIGINVFYTEYNITVMKL